jgi:hypothetical protein
MLVNRRGVPTPMGTLSYCQAMEGVLLEAYSQLISEMQVSR